MNSCTAVEPPPKSIIQIQITFFAYYLSHMNGGKIITVPKQIKLEGGNQFN